MFGQKMDKKQTVWLILKEMDSEEPKFLVGRRSKLVNNPNLWGFFGGTVDAKERIEDALLREVYEETRLKLAHCQKLFVVKTKDKDYHYYEGKVSKLKIRLNKEHDSFKFFSYKELKTKKMHLSVKEFFDHAKFHRLTFRLTASSNLKQVITAYLNNEVVGGASIVIPSGLLQDLHVKPEYQGKGYGSQIMDYIMSMPTAPTKLTAMADLGSKIPTSKLIPFYEKYGFVVSNKDCSNIQARMERK